MDNLKLKVKSKAFEIEAEILILGDDVLVVIGGGKIHIGAVGIAQPRKSLKDPAKISSTSSVFTFLGHKEDVVVKEVSEGISKALNKKVVVVAGLHWDNIDAQEINEILALCKDLEKKIIEEILTYEKGHCGNNRGNRGDLRCETP